MFPQSVRVSVLDDEPLIAMTLAKILQQHGYRAVPYVSSVQALTDARVDHPDLIISDILMPGIFGMDLAERSEQSFRNAKFSSFQSTLKHANSSVVAKTEYVSFR